MKKFYVLAAGMSAAAFSAPAMAQDSSTKDEAPTGARIEAVVGFDYARLDLTEFGAGHVHDKGALYGIGAGFDFAAGGPVSAGVDVEATDSTLKYGESGVYLKAGRDLYAGGRVSFAVGGGTSVYLKAGYTNARFKATDGVDTAAGNADGVRVGIGAQAPLSGKTYAGVEYRYSNYEGGLERHQGALVIGARF